jgi:2-octaprenyl-6-methoxyphenol hydroxylase
VADTEAAIVGGGPVGLALALSLQQSGIACCVFDARPANAIHDDARVLALSYGSRMILERLGAWCGVDATPIAAIHVSQQGGLGRTLFEAGDLNLEALGYVARAGAVAASLSDACTATGIEVRHETRVERAAADDESVVLSFTAPPGREVRARLVAWAEGQADDSPAVVGRDYAQQAVIATVGIAEPHRNIAYERFTASGPIALLPHGRGYAIVQGVAQTDIAAVLSLDDASFLGQLQQAFTGRLQFTTTSKRLAFPLALRYRQTPIAARAVWLGNAAQTLHPIAGQGFNLALRDVAELAQTLRERSTDCGDAALLARYAAVRRLDRHGTIGLTDALVRLFAATNPLLGHARGAGLLALDLLPAARRLFARRMIFGARAW